MMRRFLTVGLGLSGALGLAACGTTELDLGATLVVAMYGAFEAPADAAGTAEPKFANFTLLDVTMTKADGEVVDLYDDDPYEARIINRSQIIAELDVTDYEEESFSQVA